MWSLVIGQKEVGPLSDSEVYQHFQSGDIDDRTWAWREGYDSWDRLGRIPEFWDLFWEFAGIIASKPYDRVVDDPGKMPGAKWFAGAELNFAENLLRFRDDKTALIFQGEGQTPVSTTYRQLYDEVSRMAQAQKAAGVRKGDRVAGFMPNMPQTIIAMLAAVSLGAIWSSSSPDFGIKGVLDRFGQIEPKVLFTADGYFYNGKAFDSLEKVGGILKQLPMVEKVVVVGYTTDQPDLSKVPNAVSWESFLAPYTPGEIDFVQVPAEHPLYVMYSSGTTGKPKCMVQSHAGILTNQLKEHLLHCDLRREDVLFYFTTCGWMMWNWLVCGLGVGTTLVLYDGSPFHPGPEVLWKLAEQVGITIFGTSARYIAALDEAGYRHQVLQVDLEPGQLARVEALPVPRSVEILRLPEAGPAPLEQLAKELEQLEFDPGLPPERQPYLELRVLLERPEPGLRQQIEPDTDRPLSQQGREEIAEGAAALGLEVDDMIEFVLGALVGLVVFAVLRRWIKASSGQSGSPPFVERGRRQGD